MKVVILSGGSGTRLFPISRERFPKQFLKVFNGESLLQKTVNRSLKLVDSVDDIIFVTNRDYFFHLMADIKPILNKEPIHILQEPVKKNTAPAIAISIVYMLDKNMLDLDEPVLVLPSDHVIEPDDNFVSYVKKATQIAKDGYVVTFGIKPSEPHTGYGYIEFDADVKVGDGFKVKKFHEKPSESKAAEYIATGRFLWNSGMFCFTPGVFLEEIKRHCPDIYNLIHGKGFEEVIRNFVNMPDISVDYALMEKTDRSVVIPVEIGWSDVGSFEAIYKIMPKDENQNSVKGDVVMIGSNNNLVISDSRLVCCIDVEDLIVVETQDVVLVAKKSSSQKVKELVSTLKKTGKGDLTKNHTTDYRPWGSFTLLDRGDKFKIKRITVNPGEGLSLQMHYHRSEHWVVVKGTALVVLEDENGNLKERFLKENESVFIPKAVKHRLINPGKIPLELIEVQVGEYVEEDDIVRFEDKYQRV